MHHPLEPGGGRAVGDKAGYWPSVTGVEAGSGAPAGSRNRAWTCDVSAHIASRSSGSAPRLSAICCQSAGGRTWRGQGRQATVGAARMIVTALIAPPRRCPASRSRSRRASPTRARARPPGAPTPPPAQPPGRQHAGPAGAVPGSAPAAAQISTQAPPTSPSSKGTTTIGARWTVCITTRNSLVNRPKGGNPATAITPAARVRPAMRSFSNWPPMLGKVLHALGLRGAADDLEDGGLRQGMDGQMQQPGEGGRGTAEAEGEGRQPALLDGREREEPHHVPPAPQAERADQDGHQAQRHDRAARRDGARILVHQADAAAG